jgi:hypothetical protein
MAVFLHNIYSGVLVHSACHLKYMCPCFIVTLKCFSYHKDSMKIFALGNILQMGVCSVVIFILVSLMFDFLC